MQQELQHLRLLSILHYVLAGLLAVMACIPIIYLVLGIVILTTPASMGPGGPPPVVGWMFVSIGGTLMLLGWTGSVCLVIAGWHLGRCRHYVFCMVMAALACLIQPLGTLLGVFTIIVLLRPSVKQLFEAGGLLEGARENEEADEDHPHRLYCSPADVRTR